MSAEADHCMIDIETLGTAPGSIILSIGAVMFDPLGDGLGAEFYANIDPVDAQARGPTIDASTVLWWFDQTEDARVHLKPMRLPLDHVLGGLAAFQRDHRTRRVWGHGATFDPVLLDAAYRACGLKTPWRPYDARDTRTLYELAGVKPDRAAGLHHDALDDAKAQALAVQAAMRALGKAEPLAGEIRVAQALCDRCGAELKPGAIHECRRGGFELGPFSVSWGSTRDSELITRRAVERVQDMARRSHGLFG